MPIQIGDPHSDSLFAKRQTGLLFNMPVPDPSIEQLPAGISLCMIVKNEERFLPECLESVKDVVDEICIYDTGSTDRTVEIARQYGAKIQFGEWRNDFGWARNQSLAMATKRWTFVLDADEELYAESAALVRTLRTQPAHLTSVYINIVNFIDDPLGLGTMSHRLIRIFPTTPRIRYMHVIHECLTVMDGEMTSVLSPIKILHKGYTGEILAAREKDARNRPLLEKAYEDHGETDTFAMFNFGNSAIASGDTDRGVEILLKMLKTADDGVKMYFASAYLGLMMAYMEVYRDYDRALEMADEALTKFPKDAGIVFTRGQILAKQNKLEEARAEYAAAMALRDNQGASVMTDEEIFQWKVFYATSGTYEKEGDLATAIEWIDKAIANKPRSPHLHRTKAKMLEAQGRMFDAELSFRAAVEADPRIGEVELVNFLLRRRRFSQAISMIEAAENLKSDAVIMAQLNTMAARGMLEQQAGDPIPYLEAALRHAPGYGLAIALYEKILTERGDVAGLEKLHANELEAPLLCEDDFVRRSFRLLALGRNADARIVAGQGLQFAPGNPELRFNAALAALREGDELHAIEELGRVDDKAAEVFAPASQMRAALLLKHGDAPGAVMALRSSILAKAEQPEIIMESVRVLRDGGARPEARALLETYVDSDRRIALELATMLLADGDVQAAGAIAARALG